MFSPDTPLYLRGISPSTEVVDQETRKIIVLEFMAQPFTREMADDLAIAAELFEGGTGNPNDILVNAKLSIAAPLQRMTMRMAPDTPGGLTLDNVEIGKTISVRKDKEGPVLTATITATVRYPAGEDLLTLMNSYCEQRFITFEPQQAALPMGDGDQKPRRAKREFATV